MILKHTDYKKDQVLLQAEGLGGSSLYGQADYPNIKLFDDAIAASGLGPSHTELEKALAGKIATASMSLSSQRQYINGSSTPQDVETLLQLVYLHFTAINKDQASYDNLMRTAEIALKNKALSPDNALRRLAQRHAQQPQPALRLAHRRRPEARKLRPHTRNGARADGQRRGLHVHASWATSTRPSSDRSSSNT